MLSEACSKSTSRDLLFTMAILFPAIIESYPQIKSTTQSAGAEILVIRLPHHDRIFQWEGAR